MLADGLFFKSQYHQGVEVPPLLVLEVKRLHTGQCPRSASFSARAAFEAVQDSEKLFLILEGDHHVLALAPVLEDLAPLLQFGNEEGALHFLLLVLLELETLEVESLEEVLHCHFAPVLVRVDLLYPLQLVYLQSYLLPKQLQSLALVRLQKPLKLLLLVPMAILVNQLEHAHRNDTVQHALPLLFTLEWSFIEQSFQQTMCFFQSFHVDVELVALVFCLQQVDFVGVFVPYAEVLAFLRAIGHGHPLVVGEELHLIGLSRADDGVVDGNGDIAGRCPFRVAEIHVVERPEHAHFSPFGFSSVDDVLDALHVKFLHLQAAQQIEGLVPGDDVQVVDLDDLDDVDVALLIDLLLQLPQQGPLFRGIGESSQWRPNHPLR